MDLKFSIFFVDLVRTLLGTKISFYIRQFAPSPSPRAITHGQQVKSNSCQYMRIFGGHSKTSAFVFTVFPLVVQAEALSNSPQSE